MQEKALDAQVKKKAEADRYARQQQSEAELYERQKRAEAEKFETEKSAMAMKATAEAGVCKGAGGCRYPHGR